PWLDSGYADLFSNSFTSADLSSLPVNDSPKNSLPRGRRAVAVGKATPRSAVQRSACSLSFLASFAALCKILFLCCLCDLMFKTRAKEENRRPAFARKVRRRWPLPAQNTHID